MIVVKAEVDETDIIWEITQQTIQEVYTHYYPSGAVAFFAKHHNKKTIAYDIECGIVYLLKNEKEAVGTVTIRGYEVCRLFVLPKYHRKGFGGELLSFAER